MTVNLPATNNYAYDLNGNLLTNGTEILVYDDENQLVTDWVPSVWKSEFVYDGQHRRRTERDYMWQSSAWALTNETRFIYDGNVIIQHRDANNLPLLTLTRGRDLSGGLQGAGGIGGLLALTENPGVNPQHSYYHADGNGNVTALINANQIIVGKAAYDPFGGFLYLIGSKAPANPYWFSSKPLHRPSGKYDLLLRWYIPEIPRFANRDPLGEDGGLNLFGYLGNNPVNRVDPLGLLDYFYSSGNLLYPSGPVPYLEADTTLGNLGAGAYNAIPFLSNFLLGPLSRIGTREGEIIGQEGNGWAMTAAVSWDLLAVAPVVPAEALLTTSCLAAKEVQLEFDFVSAVERQTLARDFYRATTRLNDTEIASRLRGIDFSQPVSMVVIPAGTALTQFNLPGRVGNYYAPLGTPANTLGIYTSGLVESSHTFAAPTRALQSTAASVIDDWSMSGAGWRIQTGGGGTQYFVPK